MTAHTLRPSFVALSTMFLFGASITSAWCGTPESVIVPAAPTASPWELRAEMYGWLTGLDGDMGIDGHMTHLDASFSEIFDHIDMAAALQLKLRNGRWGFIADGFYCALSDAGTPPGPLYDQAKIKMKQFIGEMDVAYRVVDEPCGFTDVYAGFRYNYTSIDLTAERSGAFPVFPPDIDAAPDWGVRFIVQFLFPK